MGSKFKKQQLLTFHFFKKGDFFFKRETLKKEIVSHITYNFKIMLTEFIPTLKNAYNILSKSQKQDKSLERSNCVKMYLAKKDCNETF